MKTIVKAIRLAVVVEAASCAGFFVASEPTLYQFFSLLNFPVLFLSYHLFGIGIGFGGHDGRIVYYGARGYVALLVQCALWSAVFFGLMKLEEKARLFFRHHAA
jgi:hypothetical protein